MNTSNKKWRSIFSLWSYVILGILVVVTLQYDFFEEVVLYFLLALLLFVIRDIISLSGISKKIQHRSLNWTAIHNDRFSGDIKIVDMIILFNRIYLFPTILFIYIWVAFSKQLDIFWLMDILSLKPQVEWWILGFVAVSGLFTTVREELDARYIQLVTNYSRTRQSVFVILILSLLVVIVVFNETNPIWLLSLPISLISWLLIFLAGIILLDNDEV